MTTDTDGAGNLRLYRFVSDNATQTLEAELVGDLDEIAEENETDAPGYVIAGLVYIDGTLYGHETDVEDPAFYSIDPETGIMEELGTAEGYGSYGAGIATDSDGTIYGILNEFLVTIDPDDGSVDEEIAEWENNTDDGSYITDLTFVEGRLLGLVVYETAEDTILVEIDPETGETEEIGVLPGDIAAITYVP